MFEMATGKPPFCSSSLKALIQMILEADTPVVEGFSAQFNDLVSKLLQKDPIKRMCWEELKEHPFWDKRDTERDFIFSQMKPGTYDYPKQIQFDRYLESRNIVPD
jgi:serine/threonine protein kinase